MGWLWEKVWESGVLRILPRSVRRRYYWNKYYRESVAVIGQISYELVQRVQDGKLDPNDDDRMHDASLRIMEKYEERDKKTLEKLWLEYDMDQDGELTRMELEPLIVDSIRALRQWLPIMHRSIHARNMESIRNKHDSMQRREVDVLMDNLVDVMELRVGELLDEKLKNIDRIATKIYNKLDEDNDGSVTKEEFLGNFGEASSQVLDPDKLMRELNELLYTGNNADHLALVRRDTERQQSTFARRVSAKLGFGRKATLHDFESSSDDDDEER